MDAIVALINASSDKLGFICGMVFLLVVVFCEKPVVLGPVKLPAIDALGRVFSGVVGLVLMCWAVFVWTANANVGIFSRPPAQQSIVVKQDHPTETVLSTGDNIGVFVHNITSNGTADIVLFKLDSVSRGVLNQDLTYKELEQRIGSSFIIWRKVVKQKGLYPFTFDNRQHSLEAKSIDWFLFGPDYVVLSVY